MYEIVTLEFDSRLKGLYGQDLKESLVAAMDNSLSRILSGHHKQKGLKLTYNLKEFKAIITNFTNQKVLNLLATQLKQNKNYTLKGHKPKNIIYDTKDINAEVVLGELTSYKFESYWLPFSTENYKKYKKFEKERKIEEINQIKKRILKNNIIGFLKNTGVDINDFTVEVSDLIVSNRLVIPVKNKVSMEGYKALFKSNVRLPDDINLGRFMSRGFGRIVNLDTM